MKKRTYALPLSILILFFCMFISGCSSSIANASSVTGASLQGLSQAAQSSILDKDQVSLVAPANGNSYAFVRNEQLWVALNGTKPVQVTHFDYRANDGHHIAVFWNQLSWFDGDHYVAFKLLATRGGFGGGGCGYIGNDGATSALFVLNTATMRITEITVPGEKVSKGDRNQQSGYWQYLFKEDSTHLLVWHYDTNNFGGLYRYDFGTGNLSLALPAGKFPELKSFNDAFFPMRYSNGKLYYEAMNNTSGSLYDHVIYSHSIAYPNIPSVKVLDAGTHVFCDKVTGNTGLFREPGWDISPNGQYLVVQKIVKGNYGKETSAIQAISLRDGGVTSLFPQLATSDLSQDLVLSWAPDSQTILLQSPSQKPGQGAFYSTTLAQPTVVRSYPYMTNFEHLRGHIFWKSDSASFAFSVFDEINESPISNVYTFTIGKTQGQVLLSSATNFAWS